MGSKNFQRTYIKELSLILYDFEKDFNLGDFALLFINPDRPTNKENSLRNSISLKSALRHFDSLTDTSFDYPLKKSFLRKLRIAYKKVFLLLKNSKIKKNKKKQGELENLIDKNKDNDNLSYEDNDADSTEFKENETNTIDMDANLDNSNENDVRKCVFAGSFFNKTEVQNNDNEIEETSFTWKRSLHHVSDFLTLSRQTIYLIFAFNGIVVREFLTSDGNFFVGVCYAQSENLKYLAEKMALPKQLDIGFVDLMSLEPVDLKNRPLRANNALWSEEVWREQFINNESNRNNINHDLKIQKRRSLNFDLKKFNLPESPKHLEGLSRSNNLFMNLLQPKELEFETQEISPLELRTQILRLLKKINFKGLVRKTKGIWYKDDPDDPRFIDLIHQHQKIELNHWIEYHNFLETLDKLTEHLVPLYNKLSKSVSSAFLLKKTKSRARMFRTGNRKTGDLVLLRLRKQFIQAVKSCLQMSYALTEGNRMKSIWQRIGVRPSSPFIPFFNAGNRRRPRLRNYFELIWREYETNENDSKSLFSSVDRIKAIDWQVL